MTDPSPSANHSYEPPWGALNDINFLLYNRFANPLNAALSAIELSENAEGTGFSADWWRSRAREKIAATLSLVMAWSWLIQYKNGMALPRQAIRPFALSETVNWLGERLRTPISDTLDGVTLDANQETLQEALLLLYSVASSQGSGVSISWNVQPQSVKIGIQYRQRHKDATDDNLEALMQGFKSHWRSQLTALELRLAQNFLQVNGIDLNFNDTGKMGEFGLDINRGPDHQLSLGQTTTIGGSAEAPTLVEDFNASTPSRQLNDNSTIVLPPARLSIKDDSTGNWAEEQQGVAKMARPSTPALSEWKSVIEFDAIHWDSVHYAHRHTYQRLTDPVIKAMGHLDSVRHYKDDDMEREASLVRAEHHLERMVCSMKAWAALTRWKSSGERDMSKGPLDPEDIPDWLKSQLNQLTGADFHQTLGLRVNAEAFYEGLSLLVLVASKIGTVDQVIMRDAKRDNGVWLRVIFRPPVERRFKSKFDVLDSFVRSNPLGEDLATHFTVADELFKLNKANIVLQENANTGQQAFAVLIPAYHSNKTVKADQIERSRAIIPVKSDDND